MVHFQGLPQLKLLICCVQLFGNIYGLFYSLNWDGFVAGLKGDCLGLSGADLGTVLRIDFRIVKTKKSGLSRIGLA